MGSDGPVAVEVPAYCEVRYYRVRRGDTLWGIARRAYGGSPQAGLHWRDIARANHLRSTRIYAGQLLVLPVCDR